MIEIRVLGPGRGSLSLYWEIIPQTGMRPNMFMCRKTASSVGPPTFSK